VLLDDVLGPVNSSHGAFESAPVHILTIVDPVRTPADAVLAFDDRRQHVLTSCCRAHGAFFPSWNVDFLVKMYWRAIIGRRCQGGPHVSRVAEAVQHNDGWPFTANSDVNRRAISFDLFDAETGRESGNFCHAVLSTTGTPIV
jgi:hypothetical protein